MGLRKFRLGQRWILTLFLAYYDQNLALFATGYLDGRFRFGPDGELTVEWKHR